MKSGKCGIDKKGKKAIVWFLSHNSSSTVCTHGKSLKNRNKINGYFCESAKTEQSQLK